MKGFALITLCFILSSQVRSILSYSQCNRRSSCDDENEKLQNIADTLSAITSNNPDWCYAGIKNGRVPNSAMTASSHHPSGYFAYYARLDNQANDPRSVWHAAPNQADGSWLQVDFGKETRVAGVVTQGRRTAEQWITQYKILYGDSPTNLKSIECGGRDVIFEGNRDRNSHVTNYFPKPITARYFRLQVETYHVRAILRLDYLLC